METPNYHTNKLCYYVSLIFLLFSLMTIHAQLKAFPTAYGAGAQVSGGRGGIVLHVTNLNNSGTGSLRWALTDSAHRGVPRYIVFDVSGVINLTSTIYMDSFNGYVGNFTINGFSAPEGGITIIGHMMRFVGLENVLIRNIRFRNGYKGNSSEYSSSDLLTGATVGTMIDNCSFAFAEEQATGGGGGDINENPTTAGITIQNCLIGHTERSALTGNFDGQITRVSWLRNVISQSGWRTPNVVGDCRADIINNFVHNWRFRLSSFYDGQTQTNMIGNYYQAGWNTIDSNFGLPKLHMIADDAINPQWHYRDNFISADVRPENYPGQPETAFSHYPDGSNNPINPSMFAYPEFPMNGEAIPILNSNELRTELFPTAGACNYIDDNGEVQYYRDTIDSELIGIAEIDSDQQFIPKENYEATVMAYIPSLPSASRPSNFYNSNKSNHIPEVWYDANVPNGESHWDNAPSGYTWLEEYLNQVDWGNVDNQVSAGANISICEGSTASLTATGAVSYLWNTGETTAVITVNPTITSIYTVIGTHSDGSTSIDETTVTVNSIPTVNAGNDITICEGDSTVLSATGGNNYQWNTGETGSSISVSPSNTTTYSVTVYQNGCEAEDSVTVFVNEQPIANAGDDNFIIEGESTVLTASGGDSYLWDSGETSASITVSPLVTTTYSVTAFINGCQDTDNVTVNVAESAEANAGEDVTICEGEEVTLTATGGNSYLWNTGETSQSINVNPVSDTIYSVTVSIGSSSDTDDVNVFVNPIPNATVSDDVTINEGEQTVLTASGGNSYLWSTDETTQNITVNPTETTTYTVFVATNGCENFAEVTVFVNEAATAHAGEDQTICESFGTTLTASGGDSYLWSTGETTQSIDVNPEASTTYTVIVSNDFSSDTDDITVFVIPNPDVEVSGDVTILDGEFVTLSATGANSYQWSNGATQPNIAVSPSVTTSYSVTGFINNCSDTDEVVVNVIEQVDAYAGEDTNVCYGESTVLTASGGDNYLWNTGETTQSISVNPDEDTLFTVIVSNELDSEAADVMVYVDPCEIEIVEESNIFEFEVFTSRMSPNMVIVRMAGLSSKSSLLLHDLTGKLIHSEDIEYNNGGYVSRQINTSDFSNGIYLITLLEQDKQTTKRILFH